jgi:L-iduronidase
MELTVHCDRPVGTLNRFWRSTGFTPAELLLDPSMRQTIAYLGGLPRQGIEHVRIHFLLNLVEVHNIASKMPSYDWTRLDTALDTLVSNRLKPFFELMGNPSGVFGHFEDEGQLRGWQQLVSDLARHLIARYGTEEVRSWYFESWNEPDAMVWWQSEDGLRAFCNYYDVCSAALHAVDPQIRFGGPGSCRGLTDWLRTFLEHVDSGVDYVSGARGVRLDFLSIHEKGVHNSPEDLTPNSLGICERELAIAQYVREQHPRLADVPLMNNECDPQVGWLDVHTWHATAYYAAIIAKIITQHQSVLIDTARIPYSLLSNDHGFVGTWGNRTLLTRFDRGAAAPDRGDWRWLATASSGAFDLIKKPALNAMAMLALLGDTRCQVEPELHVAEPVAVLATRLGDETIAVLVTHHRDPINLSASIDLSLYLQGLPFREAMLVHYRIDNELPHPLAVWEQQGAPRDPNAQQLAALRAVQELAELHSPQVVRPDDAGRLVVSFTLPQPGVSLLLLCPPPDAAPAIVRGLLGEIYTGLNGEPQVLLRWEGVYTYSLQTYEVHAASSATGPFRRINTANLVCSTFIDAAVQLPAWYSVRAIDHWGRAGQLSNAVEVRNSSASP